MTPNLNLLRRLLRADVELVLVGGMAGIVHGGNRITLDIDVCARPTADNVTKLLQAVASLNPRDGRVESAPALTRTAEELAASEDISLWTAEGRLDVIWDVPGVGAWPEVKASAELFDLGSGDDCLVLGLDALIASKRTLGRTRDLMAIDELEEIRRRRREGR